jgi:hypothetical protein
MDETMECALMRTLVQEMTLGLGGLEELWKQEIGPISHLLRPAEQNIKSI